MSSFTDAIKRSLGFEDSEPRRNTNPNRGYNPSARNYGNARPRRTVSPTGPVSSSYYDEPISPEQPFYEIVLIRPKTIDDINYVVDQVIEEKNPVILDLSFLQKESPSNFKLAGDKIKQMRAHYGAQALLLARNDEKNLIIISPKKVSLINKN